MSVLLGTSLLSPNLWGWLADHLKCRLPLIRVAGFLTLLGFLGFFFGEQYTWMLLITFIFSFFWHASLPQIDALTLSFLGSNSHRYGNIRLWGSLGFGTFAILTGYLLEDRSLNLLPVIVCCTLLFAFLLMWAIPKYDKPKTLNLTNSSLTEKLCDPVVLTLLIVGFFATFSHAPFQSFSGIYFESAGYSRNSIGWIWALGLAGEVVSFLWMPKLIQRFGLSRIFTFGVLVHTPGWLLIGYFVNVLPLLILGQLFVSIGFAVFMGTAIGLIHQFFTGPLQGRGQAIYVSFSVGGGMMVGAFFTGFVWDIAGPQSVFSIASMITLVTGMVAYFQIK